MSFNGSGVFVINSTGNPVVTATVISSVWANALTADLGTGLSTCLTKDGQSTPTNNIPMGGFKITGLAVPTTTGDALAWGRAGQIGSLTGLLKGNGATAITAATVGTDYVAPGTATTFTALQTFSGSAANFALKLANAKEITTIVASAATGTIAFDVTTQSDLYYTVSASANWTLNFRGNGSTTLNSLMSTGETVTVVFRATQGVTPYYANVLNVDGTASGVTVKWLGVAPSAGHASSIDVYTFAILKTGSAAWTILATQAPFVT